MAILGAVEQVIDNYIDNALSQVEPNTEITVLISSTHTHGSVHVLDEGPGMSELEISKAFNRFWRATSDSHGSGLGLAIVERLVTLGGGHVQLSNRQPHGLDAQADFLLKNA